MSIQLSKTLRGLGTQPYDNIEQLQQHCCSNSEIITIFVFRQYCGNTKTLQQNNLAITNVAGIFSS